MEARTSNNASTSSNKDGTATQPPDKDRNKGLATSESEQLSHSQIETMNTHSLPDLVQTNDNSQTVRVTNVPTSTVVVNTDHVSNGSASSSSSSDSSSNSSNSDNDTISDPTTDTDISVPELKHECFVSVEKLDDRIIAKYSQKSADMKVLRSNPDSSMTLQTRPQSGLRCFSRTVSKPVSYTNMDTESNDDNDHKVQKHIKIRPSVEPSRSRL